MASVGDRCEVVVVVEVEALGDADCCEAERL